MSKTEEVKNGLKLCSELYGSVGDNGHIINTMGDAIALIEQLESENAKLKAEADARKYVRCDNCVHSVDKSIPPMLWCLAKGIRVFGGGCCEMFMDRKEYEGEANEAD